jgi:3D (Asp-Asp-Asp) domain-containing protein
MSTPRFLRSALATASLLALHAIGHAAVDPTVIPLNSQIGSLRIPLQCSFPVIGKQTLNIKLTGSMATNVTPGQPFYLTDGSGVLELPQGLVDLSYSLLGARAGTGQITELNFNITNATPTTINGLSAPIVISNLPIVKGQAVKLTLPPTGFIQVGPMTAMNKEGQILVKMGSAKGSLKLLTASGKSILWDLGVSCAAPDPAIIVLGMTVAGTPTSEVSAPHTHIRTEDLDTPQMTQSGSLRFPLSCNVQGVGRRDLDGTFNGVAPALYAPGEVFTAGTGYGRIIVPGSVVTELLNQVPGASKASTYVDVLEFSSTNTTPSFINMTANGSVIGSEIALAPGQDAVARFPASTDLAIGPFKANLTGSDTALYVGRTGAVVQMKNSAGQLLDTRRIDCDAPNPATTIVSVTIGGAAVSPAAVSGVSPTSVAAAGGATVTITGKNFTSARAVSFGGVAAKSFTVSSATKITAVVPALPAGALTVVVQGVGGSAATGTLTIK